MSRPVSFEDRVNKACLPSRLLDLELDRDDTFRMSGSNVLATSTSGNVCARGVADQSRAGGTWVNNGGGGETGLLAGFWSG